MGINFPPNPTFPNPPNVGDTWPSPPVAGLPIYRWDGEKWTTLGTGPSKVPVYTDGTTAMTAQLKLIAPPVAPEDAAAKSYVDSLAIGTLLYYGGIQINGAMDVGQELGGAGRTNPGYVCDGWQLGFSGTMAVAALQNSSPALPGFPYWLSVSVNTAQASLGAGDYCQITQPIEGYRMVRLGWGVAAAQPVTLGFWTAHTPAGIYSVGIRNGTTNRSYVAPYTQAVAGTWQYNVVTIPGDTTGTWATANTTGMYLTFAVGAGSTFTAPAANAWIAGNYAAAPGQVNLLASTTNGFRLTGVVLLPGTQAPTTAQSPLVMRPYDQELMTCKRYFQWLPFNMYFTSFGANELRGNNLPFSQMRAIPTIGPPTVDPNVAQTTINAANAAITTQTLNGAITMLTSVASGGVQCSGFRFSADARL